MSDRLSLAIAELVGALREELRTEAANAPRTPDRLLSMDEAANALGIGRTTAYLLVTRGDLRSVKVGRRRVVPSSAVADYIAEAAA